MELHFQQTSFISPRPKAPITPVTTKYVGVRQRSSGRWVAEIKDTTQKIRIWLGTFETAEDAARAYDEAAFLLRGSKTRTNFADRAPTINSPLAAKIQALINQRKQQQRYQSRNRNQSEPMSLHVGSTKEECKPCSKDGNKESRLSSVGTEELPREPTERAVMERYSPELTTGIGAVDDITFDARIPDQADLMWYFTPFSHFFYHT